MVELIDIGANLGHDSFDADRDAVIARARDAGVSRIIVTGTSIAASEQAIGLAADRPGILFATAGIHPHHATELDAAALDRLRALAGSPGVVAIGECGLDYFRDFSPRDAQRAAFDAQLEIARDTGLPVFLHQRDAHSDFIAALGPMRGDLAGGVAHCFTGGPAELGDYLDLDLSIGITGWVCDERRGGALREAVPLIPLDRLLLETDAPYLLPRTLRPRPATRRNEPSWLPHIAGVVAELMGRPLAEIAEAATMNTERLFRLATA